jgi:hypothetical protein
VGAVAVAGPFRQTWAQRPAHPIARPPRPDRPLTPGRFNPATGSVARGPLPGLFTVVKVDSRASTIQLRDDGGRTGIVHVDSDMIDLDAFQAGDVVEVDFLVPEPGSTKLQAAGIWPVQR